MKLLLVRHAQSHNNVIQASVHQRISKGELKPFEAQHEWLEQRQDDPGLTAAGHKQTAVLAKHVVRKVKTKGGGKVMMMCSPMKRACETAAAIAALLGERVELNTNLCEVGGIYAAKKVMRNALIPSFENVPGVCPSSSDLRSRYPNFDSPTLPASGPWDGGRGHESVEQAISRSQTLAHWLKSEDLQSKVGNGMLVLVSHADFIALLLAALQGEVAGKSVNPDFQVSVHGVSEAVLMQETRERSRSGTGKEPTMVGVDTVYERYRVSLACSCFCEISPNGGTVIHWLNYKKHLTAAGCPIQ